MGGGYCDLLISASALTIPPRKVGLDSRVSITRSGESPGEGWDHSNLLLERAGNILGSVRRTGSRPCGCYPDVPRLGPGKWNLGRVEDVISEKVELKC